LLRIGRSSLLALRVALSRIMGSRFLYSRIRAYIVLLPSLVLVQGHR
jgi:hypothetical protein